MDRCMKHLGAVVVLAVAMLIIAVPFAADAAEMKAGVAKAVITNKEPLVMVNGNVSEGTLHDIYARALVLNDGSNRLIIITYDLNCLDHATPFLRQRVRDELGIDPSHLLLLATHNHNAPIQINPDNFEYGKWLANRMFDLIKEAMANERGPVKVLFGNGYGYFLASVGNAPVDYEIQMLKVMHGDRPIALFFTHGTHPMQACEKKVGVGHPGYAMDEIEAAIPGVQAMYAASGAGNQFPGRLEDLRELQREARKKGPEYLDKLMEERCKMLGHMLAEAALDIVDGEFQDVTGPISSTMEVLPLPLAAPISRAEAVEMAKKFPDDVGFVAYPHRHRSTNWVRMLLRYYDKGLPFPTKTTDMVCSDDTYLIHKSDKEFLEKYDYSIHDEFPCVYEEVIVAKIGPMPFVAMQGEICAPIVMRVKDAFRRDTPIFVTGYMGEHNLYIPTRELVRQQAYQGIVIQIQYASPVGWAPEVEDEMVKGVVRMVKSVIDKE
jgi:hypothetical protein